MTTTGTEPRYGIVDPESRTALTGLDFVRGFVERTLPIQPMARTLAYDIVEAEHGRVLVTGHPSTQFCNPEGSVHGGFASALLDTCMGLAIRSTIDKGYGSLTLNLNVSFVRPIDPEKGEVHAEGRVLNSGRRVGTAEGRLVDPSGRLLAHGTTTCLIFER